MVNLNSLSLGLANCTISINDVCSVLSARMSISGAYNQLEVLVVQLVGRSSIMFC
jgi:hypothetical protein